MSYDENNLSLEQKLSIALDVAKAEYEHEIDRFHKLDGKFNMLLAVFASIVAGVGFVVQSSIAACNASVIVLICIVIALLIGALVSIIAGFFPRGYDMPDLEQYTKMEIYKSEIKNFIGSTIAGYKDCVESVQKRNKEKVFWLKLSYFLMMGAFVFLGILIIISL